MTIQNRKIIASILLVLISFVCNAQSVPPPPAPPPPPGLPIDGGVISVLVLGAIYGMRKILKMR